MIPSPPASNEPLRQIPEPENLINMPGCQENLSKGPIPSRANDTLTVLQVACSSSRAIEAIRPSQAIRGHWGPTGL